MTPPLARRASAARALLALAAVAHALLLARHLLALRSLHLIALDVVPATASALTLLDGALAALSYLATALTLAAAVALARWSAELARAGHAAGLAGWFDSPRALATSWFVPGLHLVYPFHRLVALRRALDATPPAEPAPVARDDAGYRDPARAVPAPAAPVAAAPVGLWAALWIASVALPIVASTVRLNPWTEEGVRTATLLAGAVDALRALAAIAGVAVVGRLTDAVRARAAA
jgi:hypothetical protein